MAKPSTVPTFATAANYPAGPEPEAGLPTKVDPTYAATGLRPDQKPPAENFNHLFNLYGQWAQYLNDGNMEGDWDISGSLSVEEDFSVVGDTSLGDLTLRSGSPLTLQGDDENAGQLRHGLYHMGFAPIGVWDNTSGGVLAVNANATVITAALSLNGTAMLVPLNGLSPGDRIQKIRVAYTSSGNNIATPVLRLDAFGGTPLSLSLTVASTVVSFGIRIAEFDVDVPTALYLNTTPAPFKYARKATLKVIAGSDTTLIYGIEALYDRVDIVAGA